MSKQGNLGLVHLALTLAATALGVTFVYFIELGNAYYRNTVVLPGIVALGLSISGQLSTRMSRSR